MIFLIYFPENTRRAALITVHVHLLQICRQVCWYGTFGCFPV